ncbi:DNA repair protein RadA [Hoyosella altamirensis]|uniref:DNA repair protein RadA n=1 Tax=Hoyosella altamirensis TaxID=616997 RepID=A0A839RN63_9ACTN|nr:DNA repair protein RadA [Hoyosella altamirensis]MBB3037749.1 DNA repair protein RadA/Sms [Hoyosella altamirensis]
MVRPKTNFRCSACQHVLVKWAGRCPECGAWGSIEEAPALSSLQRSALQRSALPEARVASSTGGLLPSTPAVRIVDVEGTEAKAQPTGISELDRVLGGGVVPGAVILLAGEPGVGKSTLLLEVVRQWAARDVALYVTGEESAGQVRLRAERTDALHERVMIAAESDLATILGHVEQVRPGLLIVDSVQTMRAADVEGITGGVTQVRAVTSALTHLAKTSGIAVLLIGHVTKDGSIAGPRALEHLVDVVLHFEGDKNSTLRMVRGVKNRFGATDEVGCFELRENGIAEVSDPSGLFLHHHNDTVPGTSITVAMDGKRPLLGEVQALVAGNGIPSPRRAVSGLDSARVAMILAVLERRCALSLAGSEVYAATVGGMRVTEPAADLAIALAVASGSRDRVLPPRTVVLGEVGLAGEIRPVPGVARRIQEAARLGFTNAIVPAGSGTLPVGVAVAEVSTVSEALTLLGKPAPPESTRAGPPLSFVGSRA